MDPITPPMDTPAAPVAAPSVVSTPVVTPAPAAATVTAPAPSAVSAPVASTPMQPRLPDGTFGTKGVPVPEALGGPPAAVSPVASPVEQAAELKAVIEEIEAMIDGQPTKIRADALFTLPGGETVTLADLRKSPMFRADYTRKTMEVGEQRRELERRQVALDARDTAVRTNRERMVQAQREGGAALERELRHQELMETDPDYAQSMADAEEWRVSQAVSAYDTTTATARQADDTAAEARDYISDQCTAHSELDPEEIAQIYARALQSGSATLNPSSVDRIIRQELQRVGRVTQPLSKELADVRAQLATLMATVGVPTSNAQVSQAIDRAQAPRVGTPGAGVVPITSRVSKPFDPQTDDPVEWKRNWMKQA